jgi:zinc protease
MKSNLIVAVLAALTLLSCQSNSPQKKNLVEVQSRKNTSFQLRPYQTEVLPNGLTIMWVADNSLPYVTLQTLIRSGASQDAPDREGLAAFTAGLLDKGTAKRSASQLAQDLEQVGSGFGVSVEPDYMMASASALSHNKETVLKLYREILLEPTFPQAEIDRERQLAIASLQKIADRPAEFTDYAAGSIVFGRNHPYGHSSRGSMSSLRSIDRMEIMKFHSNHFVPRNATLAVVGQYNDEFKALVRETFKDWSDQNHLVAAIPDMTPWQGVNITLIDKPDLNQAQIRIIVKGVPRNIPDYLELKAALSILGESFGSRLFEEIRVKRGLTYGISAWTDARQKTGPMGISTFTRVDKLGETVQETLNTYRKFVKDGVTNEEVSEVTAYMRGQFPRLFETPEALSRQLLVLGSFGVPEEYLKNYLVNLDNISRTTLNATIKKYFDPDNIRIIVFAPRAQAEPVLKAMGKLEVKEFKEFLQ